MYMYNIFCMYAGGASARVDGILGSQIQGPPVESGVGAPCCGVGMLTWLSFCLLMNGRI